MAGKLLSSSSIMCMAALPAFGGMKFNYFDGIVAVWLIVGIIIGRKHGMTQEVLPTMKWLAIVILAGLFYLPFSTIIFNNTAGAFNHLWSNISAYAVIAFAINLVFIWIKDAIGEKLTGSDHFGRYEYYFGMLAGLLRFACIIVVMCAIMHSRVYTPAELADLEKTQKKNFEDIRFPTYPSVQFAILTESCTGRLIVDHLHQVLIASVWASKPAETPAKKSQMQIDAILGSPKK